MSTTGADLDQLLGLWEVMGRRERAARDAGEEVGHALARMRARSGELVPPTPDHAGTAAVLGDQLAELGADVDQLGVALARADRWTLPSWVPAMDRWGRPSTRAAGVDLLAFEDVRSSTDAARVVRHVGYAHGRLARLDPPDGEPRWRNRHLDAELDDVRQRTTRREYRARRRQARLARNVRVERTRDAVEAIWAGRDEALVQRSLTAQLRASRADLRALRHGSPAAESTARTTIGRAAQAMGTSRVATVARLGGRALGVASMVYDGAGALSSAADRSYGDAASQAASAVGSALLLSGVPPLQVVGGVLVVGATAYEFRHEIAAAGRWVAGRTADATDALHGAATGVRDAVTDTATAALDTLVEDVGRAADAVGDLAEGARSVLEGLF